MKFLNKLEDAINKFLYKIFDLAKNKLPETFWEKTDKIKHFPREFINTTKAKLRILGLKSIGYPLHYIDLAKEKVQFSLVFIKDKKYKELDYQKVIIPIKNFFKNPLKLIGMTAGVIAFVTLSTFIIQNASKIMTGTQALRSPASAEQDILYIEFKKLPYRTSKNEEVLFNIQLIVDKEEQLEELEKLREEIRSNLLVLDFNIKELPLLQGKDKQMERVILDAFGGKVIKGIKITQVLEKRPEYFTQPERQLSITNINLQLFTEDTKRNRQVYINFTLLSSNRHIVNFLKQRDAELRDYLNLNVEPILPRLPLDEEGRQIIKDKIRIELQNLLRKHNVEGEIIDIYLDYVLLS